MPDAERNRLQSNCVIVVHGKNLEMGVDDRMTLAWDVDGQTATKELTATLNGEEMLKFAYPIDDVGQLLVDTEATLTQRKVKEDGTTVLSNVLKVTLLKAE